MRVPKFLGTFYIYNKMVNIQNIKTGLGRVSYSNVIDTTFKELIPQQEVVTNNEVTLEEFFILYENLFFDIPKQGTNSHQYVLDKTAEYLGVQLYNSEDIQALLDEITTLRNQLLESDQELLNLGK